MALRLIGLPFLKSVGFMPVSRLFFAHLTIMHLLYLDESGNPDDAADKHFVLAGLSAFEKNTHFLSTETEAVQTKHFPGSPPVDFHAQHIRAGKGFWRGQEKTVRDRVLEDLASIITRSYASVRKERRVSGQKRCQEV